MAAVMAGVNQAMGDKLLAGKTDQIKDALNWFSGDKIIVTTMNGMLSGVGVRDSLTGERAYSGTRNLSAYFNSLSARTGGGVAEPGSLPASIVINRGGTDTIRITGGNSSTPDAAIIDAAQTMGFLMQNSSSFNDAVFTVISKMGYIGIVPVPGTGGTIDGNNAIYGVGLVSVDSKGRTEYPAYSLAHEVGHLLDFATSATLNSGRLEASMTNAERHLAPNLQELYAFSFANNVSAQVQASSGLSIGSRTTYWGDQNALLQPGPSFPRKTALSGKTP